MRFLCIPILACFCHTTCHRAVQPAPAKPQPTAVERDVVARGQYVESRTASVFAGACHYGGEYTTSGREALLAWRFDGGRFNGVDLTGEQVVLAVIGDENLADASGVSGDHGGSDRRAILYLDASSPHERRDAAADLVLAQCGELVKDATRVVCAGLRVEIGGETYSVSAPKFELAGGKLENRACCKMPYDVWYKPFVDGVSAVVGCNSTFRFDDAALGRTWKRSGQNETFVGTFAWSRAGAPERAAERATLKTARETANATRPTITCVQDARTAIAVAGGASGR